MPGLVPLREGSRGTMVGHPTLASATCSEGEAPAPPPQQLIPAHIVADKTTARPIRAECLNISLPVYRPSFLSRLTASTRPTSRQAIARLSRPTAPDPVPGLQRLAFSWSWLCRTASIYLQTSGIGWRRVPLRLGRSHSRWCAFLFPIPTLLEASHGTLQFSKIAGPSLRP